MISGFVSDHLFKTGGKGVYRFLENICVSANATLSQKHPSPTPFKATVLCPAAPATS